MQSDMFIILKEAKHYNKLIVQKCSKAIFISNGMINIKFRIVFTPRKEGRGMGSDKGKEGTSKVFVIFFFPVLGDDTQCSL